MSRVAYNVTRGNALPLNPLKMVSLGECMPGTRPARYLSINDPDFSPRFTL